MSLALQARVSVLEATVKSQAEDIEALRNIIQQFTESPAPASRPVGFKAPLTPRQMCPKCGEKPNYFLHVKYCKGKGA